jgi:predicted amidohydrolase YtcJ
VELLLRNGTVWTGVPGAPVADALLVRDGVIAGFDARDASGAEVVDLGGGFLMPAFGDGHAHPVFAGLHEQGPRIGGLTSVAAIVAAVREYAGTHRAAEWIVGGGYDPTLAPRGEFDARWLDEAVPDRPVVLRCGDYHGVWCNSAALRRIGPADVEGVLRRADGSPLGTLREWDACALVLDLVPPRSPAELEQAVRAASRVYAAAGVTWVQDAWVDPGAGLTEAYLAAAGPVRVGLALRADPGRWPGQLDVLLAERASVLGDLVTAGTVKFFADGVIENGTAALLEAYEDAPHSHGSPVWQAAALAEAVAAVDRAGFDVHIHAIGDAGVRAALDAIEHTLRVNPPRVRRPVVAHLQLVHPDDVPRFTRLGVVANFEPLWAQCDPVQPLLTAPRIGRRRTQAQYPIKALLDAGAHVSFGSDWPVSSPAPLAGIQTAVTRRGDDGPALGAEQGLTVAQALAAYTAGSAYQASAEQSRGVLAPGRVADLVHLGASPLAVEPSAIGDIPVLGTWLAGRPTYRAAT